MLALPRRVLNTAPMEFPLTAFVVAHYRSRRPARGELLRDCKSQLPRLRLERASTSGPPLQPL